MAIITQENANNLFNQFYTSINDALNDFAYVDTSKPSSITFLKMMEALSLTSENLVRGTLKSVLEKMDFDFRNQPDRTQHYYVKNTRPRTIITMFGVITYTRTEYKSRLTGKPFIYVDERIKLSRRMRFTLDVRSYVYEAYADENSMIKIGKEVGNLIYSKFSLKPNSDNAISRQTIHKMINSFGRIQVKENEKRKVESIYVLLDEKYIGSQEEDVNSIMCKAALIFEDRILSSNNRHEYINKTYYSSHSDKFSEELLDVIYDKYDIEHLKNIYVMGDGALWIKNCANDLKVAGTELLFGLDKFHAGQAINRITNSNKELNNTLLSYLINDDKKNFKSTLSALKEDNLRVKIIEDNEKYILNNYKFIRNSYDTIKIGCAMEQVISHHLASSFASVPKAYKKEFINNYLAMRDMYRSDKNLKTICALSNDIDTEGTKIISNEEYDFSIFESKSTDPYYSTDLRTGKKPASF